MVARLFFVLVLLGASRATAQTPTNDTGAVIIAVLNHFSDTVDVILVGGGPPGQHRLGGVRERAFRLFVLPSASLGDLTMLSIAVTRRGATGEPELWRGYRRRLDLITLIQIEVGTPQAGDRTRTPGTPYPVYPTPT